MKSLWSRRGERKELKRAADDRIRDEKLNSIILNSYDSNRMKNTASKPYDVNYGYAGEGSRSIPHNTQNKPMPMLQLIESTDLSSRKFVLSLSYVIRIGSGLNNNDIVVASSDIAEHQCEIFSAQDKVYIRNTGDEVRTIVRRGKKQTIADNKGIRILTGDKIILGNISYEVTIIEA